MTIISQFYKRYSLHLLLTAAIVFPYLYYQAETLPQNNDIETWLPRKSAVRTTYDDFKAKFGGEEMILVGLDLPQPDPALEAALCDRIERLPGIRTCWSPARFAETMRTLKVPEDAIAARLEGLARSSDGQLAALLAVFSDEGLRNRAKTVESVKEQIAYCQLDSGNTLLAGGPVLIAEMDHLGSRQNNKRFFAVTLLICAGLLTIRFKSPRLTVGLIVVTVWAIQTTMGLIHIAGGEMNFILSALSVMVMIFCLAISIHVVHYYGTFAGDEHAVGRALTMAAKPCILATLTTVIGLASLGLSEIGPVQQFGYAASLGAVVALFAGLVLVPAVITVCRLGNVESSARHLRSVRLAYGMIHRSRRLTFAAGLLVLVSGAGLVNLSTSMDPIDFLPKSGVVRRDVERIQQEFTNINSIEAVVDFGEARMPFLEQLKKVRGIERTLHGHPAVRHTVSAGLFFPDRMPEGSLATAQLLNTARAMSGTDEFLAGDGRYWRISVRLWGDAAQTEQDIFADLERMLAAEPVILTGVAPMLEYAQTAIFNGFWESFTTAFLIITGVMIISLGSLRTGLVAMIPNLTPIAIVFGMLGWLQIPIDIGTMMTASIALGIAVDGTFHFLVRYREQQQSGRRSADSSLRALLRTGAPIFESAVIAAVGMLALTLSSFNPTARFGLMMAALMVAALIGDLVLLPCLLALRGRRRAVRTATEPPAETPATDTSWLRGPHTRRASRRRMSRTHMHD